MQWVNTCCQREVVYLVKIYLACSYELFCVAGTKLPSRNGCCVRHALPFSQRIVFLQTRAAVEDWQSNLMDINV